MVMVILTDTDLPVYDSVGEDKVEIPSGLQVASSGDSKVNMACTGDPAESAGGGGSEVGEKITRLRRCSGCSAVRAG